MHSDQEYTAEPFSIDDGYGVIGVGFKCGNCESNNYFVTMAKGDSIICEICNKENYCKVDYE